MMSAVLIFEARLPLPLFDVLYSSQRHPLAFFAFLEQGAHLPPPCRAHMEERAFPDSQTIVYF